MCIQTSVLERIFPEPNSSSRLEARESIVSGALYKDEHKAHLLGRLRVRRDNRELAG